MRRSLQRQWKRSLASVALLIALGQAPALATTVNVGGNYTLVRAIVAAHNTTASGHCRKEAAQTLLYCPPTARVLPANSTQTLTAVNNSVNGANL
jgi:predicted transglutaminase-like cysteine proteinase